MPKINIGGESVELDFGRMPLHEALALQKATGWRPPELGEALAQQDMMAIAGLAWLVVHFRMGKKDVSYDDICEGRYVVDLSEFSVEADDEPDPTGGSAEEKTSTGSA